MIRWMATTPEHRLVESTVNAVHGGRAQGLELTGEAFQSLRGFGGCFNELGYQAMQKYLSPDDEERIFKELFDPGELNFVFNRTPVGANDFAEQWYSYDETDGDYALEHFSVEHDESTLIPYIRHARRYQPDMQLFASPWSPPTWMKFPKAYNFGRIVMTPDNLDAYARYCAAYIREYERRGIPIAQLHVQNEVFADQKFPSCLWSSEDMKVFIRDYLGPTFAREGLSTSIFLGTLNGPEDMAFTGGYGMRLDNYSRYVDDILFDDEARRYIAGVGYQWAGQHCIARTHESWPGMELIQTESECGDGTNSWEYAEYVFHLINHYLRNGATAYTYWNMVLSDIVSTWGWRQNSLYSVDSRTGTFTRNPEWYVMRHFSAYVHPGARVLGTVGHFNAMGIALRNLDGSLVVVVQNALDRALEFDFCDPQNPGRGICEQLEPRSFNTFVID
ncbi:MAG: glycosyl hydrolase [Bifidobacterium sp.]|nr:glycosyl hydrolase [Bifidobacterium sp.]MCI1865878.1 glycosyl hydrolase [Bifidobacterium sp.]